MMSAENDTLFEPNPLICESKIMDFSGFICAVGPPYLHDYLAVDKVLTRDHYLLLELCPASTTRKFIRLAAPVKSAPNGGANS